MSTSIADGRFYGEVCRSRRVADLVFAETRYREGSTVPMHAHESPLLCLVLHGAFEENSRGSRRLLRRGAVLFHPHDEPHAHRFDRPLTQCFSVQLGPRWLSEASRGEQARFEGPRDDTRGRLAWLAAQLHDEFARDEDACPLVMEGLLLAMLGELTRRPEGIERGRPAWLARARDLLEASLRQPLRLPAIAADVGVHPAHLSRSFRRAFGESVSAYVLRRRVELAGAVLDQDADVSLAQVANETGFADQSHLCRSFRRVTGLTPGAWRRRR